MGFQTLLRHRHRFGKTLFVYISLDRLAKDREPIHDGVIPFQLRRSIKEPSRGRLDSMTLQNRRVFADGREKPSMARVVTVESMQGSEQGGNESLDVSFSPHLDHKPPPGTKGVAHAGHRIFRIRHPMQRRIGKDGVERLLKREGTGIGLHEV